MNNTIYITKEDILTHTNDCYAYILYLTTFNTYTNTTYDKLTKTLNLAREEMDVFYDGGKVLDVTPYRIKRYLVRRTGLSNTTIKRYYESWGDHCSFQSSYWSQLPTDKIEYALDKMAAANKSYAFINRVLRVWLFMHFQCWHFGRYQVSQSLLAAQVGMNVNDLGATLDYIIKNNLICRVSNYLPDVYSPVYALYTDEVPEGAPSNLELVPRHKFKAAWK